MLKLLFKFNQTIISNIFELFKASIFELIAIDQQVVLRIFAEVFFSNVHLKISIIKQCKNLQFYFFNKKLKHLLYLLLFSDIPYTSAFASYEDIEIRLKLLIPLLLYCINHCNIVFCKLFLGFSNIMQNIFFYFDFHSGEIFKLFKILILLMNQYQWVKYNIINCIRFWFFNWKLNLTLIAYLYFFQVKFWKN